MLVALSKLNSPNLGFKMDQSGRTYVSEQGSSPFSHLSHLMLG